MIPKTEVELLMKLWTMPSLHDMEAQHLKELASIATEVEFPAGEIVYHEGDAGQAIYLIEEGQVVIEMTLPDGNQVTVLTLGPGQLFGWSSLFPPRRKTASTRTITPTKVISIDAGRLRHLFQSDHSLEHVIMLRMIEVVAERMQATRQLLAKALAQVTKNNGRNTKHE